MDQESIIAEIEDRASRSNVAIAAACHRAGIAPSTFYRWKKGAEAGYTKLINLGKAVDVIRQERAS